MWDKILLLCQDALKVDLVKAGMVTVIFSAILYKFQEFFRKIIEFIILNIKSTVTCDSNHYDYHFFSQWCTKIVNKRHFDYSANIGYGTYYKIINKRPTIINISKIALMDRILSKIEITSYFCKSLPEYIDIQLKEYAKGKIQVESFTQDYGKGYCEKHDKITKPLLPTKSAKKLCSMIKSINNSKLDKIGIILYGEPGTGKSRAVLEIAKYLSIDVKNLTISKNTSVSTIHSLLSGQSDDRKILLLEDFDRLPILNSDDKNYNLNFSHLLNMLDGIIAPKKDIIIATVNNYKTLDKALLRSGRFDIHLKFDYPTEEEVKDLYTKLLGNPLNYKESIGKSVADTFRNIKMRQIKQTIKVSNVN